MATVSDQDVIGEALERLDGRLKREPTPQTRWHDVHPSHAR